MPAVLGNFLVPIMVGARDLAFPRLNLMSWYIYNVGCLFTVWALLHDGIDTGWTSYTPYSTRFANTPFTASLGGDPLLFQHLFWFYSHPAVYIMILPAMGVVSEIVPAFARKKIFGYRFIAYSSLGLAVLSFLVWAHHMFVAGMSIYAAAVFSALSMLVAVPSAVKVFNWTATLYQGSVSWETPMLYALGFIGLFTMGGLTGVMLATLGIDVHVHDTYFIIAHFHYIMVGGAIMAYLGGIHFWWPKMTGRMYPEIWGKLAALTVFL